MPKRIQRHRTKGWRMPPNCRCVTRPGVFGNPFESAVAFRAWLERGEIWLSELLVQGLFPWTPESKAKLDQRREKILKRLPELRGLDLACYCGPTAECHADVLIDLANREEQLKE